VTKVDPSAEVIEVLLVDKGDIKVVKVEDVRRLPKDFCSIPKVAVPCKLDGVKPPNGESRFSGDYFYIPVYAYSASCLLISSTIF